MSLYLVQETTDRIVTEDGLGFLKLESLQLTDSSAWLDQTPVLLKVKVFPTLTEPVITRPVDSIAVQYNRILTLMDSSYIAASSNHVFTENGFRILLEDLSGSVIDEFVVIDTISATRTANLSITDRAINYGEALSKQVNRVLSLTDRAVNYGETLTSSTAHFLTLSDTATKIIDGSLSATYGHVPQTYSLTISDTGTLIREASAPVLAILPHGPIRIYPANIRFPQVGGPAQKISVYQTNYSGAFTATSSDPTKVHVIADPHDARGFLITSLVANTTGVSITVTGGA